MTLPKLFEDRMRELLKEEFEDFILSFEQKNHNGLRVNTLKISVEEFEAICPFNISRIPWIQNGYYYEGIEQPARHPYYHAGLYYIQEPSAMTPANILPVEPGDKVLDLCAAPGGKSTELGAKLQGDGLLVSNDISHSRAKALLKNLELLGVRNSVILSEASEKLARNFENYFDKILVDAPCSGEGMFRKKPAIMKNWEECGVDYYSNLQKEIILSAAKMLKPGGKMVYSTCTFSPEENEGTIAYLLEECPGFRVINPRELRDTEKEGITYEGFSSGRPEWVNGPEELKNCIRMWPHKINGEGHFIALLEKGSTEVMNTTINHNRSLAKVSKEAEEFIKQLGFSIELKDIEIREEKLLLLPKTQTNLQGLRIMRQGLLLGEMKKNRFEPSQALASAMKMKEYEQVINLTSDNPDTIKYLKCETIEVDGNYKDGWQLVCVDGHPLGWGKLSKGSLKNKYYSGWRWM